MLNPDETKKWEASTDSVTALESMAFGRVNHNAVILLDGSVLIVGGVEKLPSGTCVFRTTPERFKPPEIFGGPAGWTWQQMDVQMSQRNYHSVAGLLPDGRVFSAGGMADEWSVELYGPPYMYKLPRPEILTEYTSPFAHGQQVPIDVKVRGGGEVDRVALVRIGTSTHAFDMSQRYICLPEPQLQPPANEVWSGLVTLPPNGFVAPPGWYMLTAIGGTFHTPSPAKWIKIE
jgi:hypothetical protein